MVHVAFLVLYSLAQIALGLYLSRRVTHTGDFFVAGRTLGPGLLFSTLLAANIGAGSTVGAAGLGYRDGLSALWWVASAGLGSIVLALWVGPKLRRIAAEHDLRTVGDFLEWRYDHRVRAAVSVLVWFGALAVLAAQLVALGFLLDAALDWPKWLAVIIGGLVVVAYAATGGLKTSVWLNVIQLSVKMLGFALALPLALAAVGGLDGLRASTPEGSYWSPWRGGGSGWIYVAMLMPAFIVSPGILQKLYGARDDRAVRWGVGLNSVALLLFAAVPPLAGMISRGLHPDLAHRELALPTLLMHDVPPLVGALGLAALFSAEVSAADAALFMLSTSLSQDFYRRFVSPHASDAHMLTITRLTAFFAAAAAMGLAIVSPAVTDALSVFYTMFSVSLFVPILGGLYGGRLGTSDVLLAMAAGISMVVASRLGAVGASGNFTPAMAGLIGAVAAAAVATAVRPRAG
jgi:SSS family solute:Na+ symporter